MIKLIRWCKVTVYTQQYFRRTASASTLNSKQKSQIMYNSRKIKYICRPTKDLSQTRHKQRVIVPHCATST